MSSTSSSSLDERSYRSDPDICAKALPGCLCVVLRGRQQSWFSAVIAEFVRREFRRFGRPVDIVIVIDRGAELPDARQRLALHEALGGVKHMVHRCFEVPLVGGVRGLAYRTWNRSTLGGSGMNRSTTSSIFDVAAKLGQRGGHQVARSDDLASWLDAVRSS